MRKKLAQTIPFFLKAEEEVNEEEKKHREIV